MIARIPPPIAIAAVAAWCGMSAFTWRGRRAPPAPISGVLYSVEAKTEELHESAASAITTAGAAASFKAGLPSINVALDSSAKASLPARQDFLVHVVAPEVSSFTIVMAKSRFDPAKRTTKTKAKAAISTVVAVATAAVAAPPQSAPTPAPEPPKPPEPAAPASFSQFDEALRQGTTAKTVNTRTKTGGITFRITHVGKIGEKAAVRYAIANQEAADFFLSIINVTADGKAIRSDTLGPYVCPASGTEIFGIVLFNPGKLAGKKITLELVQSGGDHRRIDLDVDYSF